MTPKMKPIKTALAVSAALIATAALAATLIELGPITAVSTSDPANNAFKAKMGWISYLSGPYTSQTQYDVKAQILVYADGAAGAQNIYVARSVDNGATWSEQAITSTGGASLSIGASTFSVTHNKPNIYVAPTGAINGGKGADALITYTSSDCQGVGTQKINNNLLTGPQPYMCLWAARSVDGGVTWTKQRLTDGSLDADEDVPAGYVNATLASGGFAISYQADPAGLQQGDAEGPGDGASGSRVSPGTNIWYTFLSKTSFENGNPFPAPVQVTDNNTTAVGDPGASRANLAISGGTAVLAYEEVSGTGAKQIIYHSFPYATPDTNSAGTVISNDLNARRVRFVLQGNDAIGDANGNGDAADGDTAGVHVLLLWRGSASTVPASAADIVIRRGIKNTVLRPGSTGFLPTDVLADTPVTLSSTGANDNALAHRAVLRGEFAAVAYDHTPDKTAADAYTATYNLYIKRSTDGGATWSAARNMTNITDPAVRVVEPRMVPTPGSIKLPTAPSGSATGDATDVQNRNVYYVAWGTETNAAIAVPGDIYFTRTTDQGLNYETVQVLAGGTPEESETQLRVPPDGKSMGALWMQRDATTGATDVGYRNGTETTVPDPVVRGSSSSGCSSANGRVSFDPTLPALAVLGLIGALVRRGRRRGAGATE